MVDMILHGRHIIIFYPEKFNISIVESNFNTLISIIRIELPRDLFNKYSHRDYLSGLIKLGINREKIGDILVFENGADIIVSNEIVDFLYSNLNSLTRFQKSNILTLPINELRNFTPKKEELKIIIPSLRLDCIVASLCHTSRNKALEIIQNERVLINYITITKTNTLLKTGDILTIRKNGKYDIINIIGNTKKGNIILNLNKYI